MPVGQRPSKNYYTLSKDGRVRHKDRDGNESYYDFIEGILTKIDLYEDDFEGAKVWKYHFYMEDRNHTQTDILQVGETASASRGILTTLISCPDPIGRVYIAPYRKDAGGKTYTNVWVEVNGDQVEWDQAVVEAVPDIQIINHGGQMIKDDRRRRLYFRKMAERITHNKLYGAIAPVDTGKVYGVGEQEVDWEHSSVTSYSEAEPPRENLDNIDLNKLDDDLPF